MRWKKDKTNEESRVSGEGFSPFAIRIYILNGNSMRQNYKVVRPQAAETLVS